MNSTVFNSTMAAASHRQEEKQYGDEIFRNLHALAIFQKPSDQLAAMLTPDMFYRANTKAFAHVMHFLFTILIEPREFRKHFFWPIIDKTAETNFRTASMAQMNALIQKHNLALESVKTHIVVLPGGLKFMKILYEFTVLAMRETVAKNSKGDESMITHPLNKNCQLEAKRCQQFFDVTKSMDDSHCHIKKALHKIESMISALSIDQQITSDLLESWQRELDAEVSQQIEPKFKAISSFAKQCVQLNDQVQTIASNRHKKFVAVDKDELKRCQSQLSAWLPTKDMQNTIRQLFVSNEFNYSNISTTFEAILPAIIRHISSFHYRRLDDQIVSFESGLIDQMCTEVLTLKTDSDAQLKRVETYFEYAMSKFPLANNKENESPDDPSNHRFVSTPPIRVRPSAQNPIIHTHLPWKLEEMTMLPPSSAKKQNRSILGTPTRSFHGTPTRHNGSMNTSVTSKQARSNAMTMLNLVRERCTARTDNRIRQEPQSSANLSASLIKTVNKPLNYLSPSAASTKTTTSSSTSTFYSGAGSTRVFTENLYETSTTLSPDTIVLRQRRETSSVIRLQGQSVHDANFLRTSPTGRFIIPDSHPTHTLTLDETAPKADNTTLCEATPMSNDQTVIEASFESGSDASNTTVTARKILFSPETPSKQLTIEETDDVLFNVSDSVLQDITM